MVYIFIHALESPPNNNTHLSNHDNLVLFEAKKNLVRLTKGQKEFYRKRWVTDSIDAYLMLHCFEGILGLIDFDKRLSFLKKTGKKYNDYNDYSPDFELDRTKYYALMNLFENKYPLVYKLIKQNENYYFREDSPLFQHQG
jgi:hypothetical protein